MLKISVVTPSLNQAEFLEETINSVLGQEYPNLEYIIIDGGSTDGSVETIKKYAHHLKYWVSEPDKGRGDAINKGFKHATGEIMAWLGCGDKYCPWALEIIGEIFNSLPEIDWLTSASPLNLDKNGRPCLSWQCKGFSRKGFFDGRYLPLRGTIQQESTFWRRDLWERAGGYVDEKFRLIPDFELWSRVWRYAQLYTLSVPLGGIRIHDSQDKLFSQAFEIARGVLKKGYRHKLSVFYHDARYFISRLPILEYLVSSYAPIITYTPESDKWLIKKILI
jgi:glycosyltransferase involved in cell wall biosynthesis